MAKSKKKTASIREAREPMWTKEQSDGQSLMELCKKDCEESHTRGPGFLVFDTVSETGRSTTLLDTKIMTELLILSGVFDVRLQTCAYGIQLDGQEGTDFFVNQSVAFRTNMLPLATLGRVCPGVSKTHIHVNASALPKTRQCDNLLIAKKIVDRISETGLPKGTKRRREKNPVVEFDNLGRKIVFEDSRWHSTKSVEKGDISNRSAFSTPLTLRDSEGS